MGIPVIDAGATYSFASTHPFLAVMIILLLIAIGALIAWATRKFPKLVGKARLALIVMWVALLIATFWAVFENQPAPLELLFDATQKALESAQKAEQ